MITKDADKQLDDSLRRIYEVMEQEAIKHQALELPTRIEMIEILKMFAEQWDLFFSYCYECGAINKEMNGGGCPNCEEDRRDDEAMAETYRALDREFDKQRF